MRYDAVLFDLFDTLVHFDRDRMPVIRVNGREVRSTAGRLHQVLCGHMADLTLDRCWSALWESWQEAERQRALDHREVAAPARFRWMAERLALDPVLLEGGLLQALLDAHRGELSKAVVVPDHHRTLLKNLAGRYRLAVVSNFDYSPTALGVLDTAGLTDFFMAIVVSDEIGWRKPRPEIFAAALGALGVPASRALFVGDRADIDVLGAQGVGMDAAWVNPAAAALPEGIAPPTFEIRDLAELGPLLNG